MHEHEHRREYVISEAVRAGKFSESRADHYRQMFDADPPGTERVLAALASALPGEHPYPPELFPELARSRNRRSDVQAASHLPRAPLPQAPSPQPSTGAVGAEGGVTSEQVAAWSRQLFPETRGVSGRIVRCND
jgi:hypothetical protein